MASVVFASLVEHDPSAVKVDISHPLPAAKKAELVLDVPSTVELDQLQWGRRLTGPEIPVAEAAASTSPKQLEDSRTSSPAPLRGPDPDQQHVQIAHSMTFPYMNRWRVFSAAIQFFIQGMNDSATGALLPYIKAQYHLSYSLASVIFVTQAFGFIGAAIGAHQLTEHFGRSKVLPFCASLNLVAYTALVCTPPFPVVVIAFLLSGFAFGMILALDNVFIVNLHNGTVNLSYMHGLYGVGGVIAPFLATLMVSNGIRWSLFYAIPLGFTALVTVLFAWSFRGYEAECAPQLQQAALERRISRQSVGGSIWIKALKNRTSLLGALFIFGYQGAEVAISGWMISFLIDYRNGDPSKVGYVTSGFWGGITLGRFVLTIFLHKIGDRVSLAVLTALTAALQLLVWLVPNIIGDSVVVGLVGFLLGPLYPVAAGVFVKLLPSELHVSSISFISSMGSSGGAIAPLITGLLAQKLGTVVLNPVCLVLYVVMEIAWLSLPKISKRKE